MANAGSYGAFSYSKGWRFNTPGPLTWITNMAYLPGQYIPYFSSPLVSFLGVPTGTPLADNARSINNTAVTVASFRDTTLTNNYPDVTLTAPYQGYIGYRPDPVTLTANATDNDGTITQVDFYSDNTYLGTVTTPPYDFTTVLNPGSHHLTAWAYDDDGAFRISCAVSVQVKSSLPLPWTENDIGTVPTAGEASFDGTTMALSGTGVGLVNSGADDNFYFVGQPLCGNGSIVARLVTAISSGTDAIEPGLIMRQNLTPGSQEIGIQLAFNPSQSRGAVSSTWRLVPNIGALWSGYGVTFSALPYWAKIERLGNVLNTFSSTDGVTWSSSAGPVTIVMGQTIQVGFSINNFQGSGPVTATFDNISVSMSCSPPTVTLTPTRSSTPTLTRTPTFTPTGSWTYTATNTPTITPTVAQTLQVDNFPTHTSTASSTPSMTSTLAPTGTPTDTPTLDPTETFTETSTLTLSATSTDTPLFTLTATSTASSTDTPMLPVPTDSMTPTPTASLTASSTPTETPTLVPTDTRTATFTSTASSTRTDTVAPPTLTFTATLTGTSTLTLTPTLTRTSTPTVSLLTPTSSSTPTLSPGNSPVILENPARQGTVGVLPPSFAGPGKVTLELFTPAYRRVALKAFSNMSNGTVLPLALLDDWGKPLANGLYYLRVTTPSGKFMAILIVAK